MSKTPAKSDTPTAKPVAKKTASKAAPAPHAPAKKAAPDTGADAGSTTPRDSAVEEHELATETTTPAAGDAIHRFTDRFAPA